MGEKEYWGGFSVFSGIGPMTFQNLLRVFGSANAAWHADEQSLEEVLKQKKTKDFLSFRQSFDFEKYKGRLKKASAAIVTLQDQQYPQLLKKIKTPPFTLYIKGDIFFDYSNARTIAIVGTRKSTQYGRDVTGLFTQKLVQAGCTIVSGLAMGVDAVAHQTTIENGGKTIAVLGCGVDCCYPRENQKLYDEIIASGGVIISEVPLGMSATVGTFPARNRIVAGLSEAVLVTEGSEDSGALITADFAFANNRKVFAVPGPITSQMSKGPYLLIEKGAKLATRPADVLQELRIRDNQLRGKKKKIIGDSEEEQEILNLLENEPMSFDEIVRKVKMDSGRTASIISMMEIKGVIINHNNGVISLTK